jgi:glycosyltransferase involved in cell wall biosynthesis
MSTRKISVLALFVHHYQWGKQIRGDERRFLELSKRFKKLDVLVEVVELEPSIQDSLKASYYHSTKLRIKVPDKQGVFDYPTKLFRLIIATLVATRKSKYDLIYIHNQDAENIFPAFFLKLISGKPLVFVFQFIPSTAPRELKNAFISRVRDGFNPFSAFVASFLEIMTDFIYQRADYYITTSRAVTDGILSRGIPKNKVTFAGNGADTTTFRPEDRQKIYDSAFLGRLHPQKGIDVLLDAWRSVVKVLPDATLVLIGGGYERHVTQYRKQIRDLNLEKNVRMAGFVSDESELVKLLNSSRTFVFPSRYEGFALVVAEAMACGLPCIVTELPALEENYSGAAIFVKPDDAKSLSDAIIRLLNSKQMLGEMSREALRRASTFKWDDVAQKELDVFRLVLSSQKTN